MSLAEAALACWSGGAAPRLISHRENAVYDVTLSSGQRAALRLHRPGYRTDTEIVSELWWCNALAERGFPAPAPIPLPDGDLIANLREGERATLIAWVDGDPIGSADEPLPANATNLYQEIGSVLAQLHDLTDALTLPQTFTRPNWDREALVGDDPLWGRYWAHPSLSPDERDLIQTARANAAEILDAAPGLDTGLIHADALRENTFRTAHGLTLIDYDDSGFGYRMYEFAVALSQSIDDPDYDTLATALIRGYRAGRDLPEEEVRLLPMFAMLRTFAGLGWIIPRLAPDHSKVPTYIRRATQTARRFLER